MCLSSSHLRPSLHPQIQCSVGPHHILAGLYVHCHPLHDPLHPSAGQTQGALCKLFFFFGGGIPILYVGGCVCRPCMHCVCTPVAHMCTAVLALRVSVVHMCVYNGEHLTYVSVCECCNTCCTYTACESYTCTVLKCCHVTMFVSACT